METSLYTAPCPPKSCHISDHIRLSVAGWVPGGMLRCCLGCVVTTGCAVTRNYPAVEQYPVEVLPTSVEHGFERILGKLGEMMLLPSDLSLTLLLHKLQWEIPVLLPVISLLVGLLFTFRLVQSVRSHLYGRREKRLAEALAAVIEEKCQLIDKLSDAKEEHVGVESSLENARREKDSFNVPRLADTYRKAKRTNMMLREELNCLVQELKEERAKRSKQGGQVMEMLIFQCLEEIVRLTTSQGAFPQLPGDQEPSPGGPLLRSSGPGY